jgi:hypothetical protein
MRLGHRVDQLVAGGGEADQRAAAVVRIGLARDQAGLLEPVEALGPRDVSINDSVRSVGRRRKGGPVPCMRYY